MKNYQDLQAVMVLSIELNDKLLIIYSVRGICCLDIDTQWL